LARENRRENKKETANTKSAFKPDFLSLLNFIGICVYLSRENRSKRAISQGRELQRKGALGRGKLQRYRLP
jgi:hypothetical protein